MLTVGVISALVGVASGVSALVFRIRSGRRKQRVEEARARAEIERAKAGKR